MGRVIVVDTRSCCRPVRTVVGATGIRGGGGQPNEQHHHLVHYRSDHRAGRHRDRASARPAGASSKGVRLLAIRSSSNSSMSAVDGLPPRRRIDALTAARSASCRSMALTSRCFTAPQSPDNPDAAFDRRREHTAVPVLTPACRRLPALGYLRTSLLGGSMSPRTEKVHRVCSESRPPRSALLAVAMLFACSRNRPPEFSLRQRRVPRRDGKVYYLNAFPGKAFEMSDADAASFEALDSTYGRDKATVFVNGYQLTDADAGSFELLDRPNFAKDSHHVYQHDRVISDDPAHFVLLDGDFAKDRHVVYWSDGSVLSEDPAHFAIVSNADNYLFTKDGRTVHVNGNDPMPTRDICSAARRLRPRRPTRLLLRPTDRRCGSVVLPSARRSLRERLRPRLLDRKDHRRRGSADVSRTERRLRMLSRRRAHLLPTSRHRRRRPAQRSRPIAPSPTAPRRRFRSRTS